MVSRVEGLASHVGGAQIDTYQRDGVVCLRGVFDRHWLDMVDRGIRRNLEDPKLRFKDLTAKGATGRFLMGDWNWFFIPEFRDFALHSPAGEIAGELMQATQSIFFEDTWFIKEPGAIGRTPWHQDEPYYQMRGNFCTVWMPLDPVDAHKSIEFVRGSHRWGRIFMPSNFEDLLPRDIVREVDGVLYEITPDIENDRSAYDIVSWSMQPGDCVVFSARTLHGGPGNLSTNSVSRRLATKWADADAHYFDKKYSWTSFVPDHGLETGDFLRGEKFPIVWRRPDR